MIFYGRAIGQLSTRLTHARLYQTVKYLGNVNINKSCYSSDVSNKKSTGTTIKPEECVPKSKYSKSQKEVPPCEFSSASCPPDCNPNEAGKQSSNNNGKNDQFRYWYLLAAFIVTGVAGYTLFSLSSQNGEKADHGKVKKKGKRKLRRYKPKVQVPAKSNLIPSQVPYLLIGGGTAAFSAFRSIKSIDPRAMVLVISEEEELPYMRPPLSKELWYNTDKALSDQLQFNQWNGTQRSIFYEPSEFYSTVDHLLESEKGGVAVATGWKVKKLDIENKIAFLEDGYEIKYGKCLIATGASPKNLPIFESAEDEIKEKITTYRTKNDFLDLMETVSNSECKNIAIIGGGFLGSELACVLAKNFKSKNIYQIYKERFIMAQVLPKYLSKWATKIVEDEGVKSISTTEVQDYKYKDKKLSLVLNNDKTIDVDQVIVAVGVQPNTDLAKTSQLEIDPKIGGFVVNPELEARSNVYVAGDAACFYDVKLLSRRRVEHHDHAVISGRLAGENMTGAGKPYLHQSMFWSDLGLEVGYEAVGIVDSSLPTVAIFAKGNESEGNPVVANTSDEEQKTSSEESQANEKSKTTSKIVENADHVETQKKQAFKNDAESAEQSKKQKDFSKGVIFYLRDDTVVGIVLWNLFSRMPIAKLILARGTKYEELNEIAKEFAIHDE